MALETTAPDHRVRPRHNCPSSALPRHRTAPKRSLRIEQLEPRQLLAADLVISELMARNASAFQDEDAEFTDWIEIHNRGDSPVDLGNFFLSDDADRLGKWQLPSQVIAPDQYLIVFASGKDRAVAGAELHTNFKLDGAGEFLALAQVSAGVIEAVAQYAPQFPLQVADISYGLAAVGGEDAQRYFATPTPGGPNGTDGLTGFVADVQFSAPRGFYQQTEADGVPLEVAITSATAGAVIVYTTNGTVPAVEQTNGNLNVSNGTVYAAPIPIATTTPLRAAAFKTGLLPTSAVTHTYIFPQDVIRQSGAGLPDTWGTFPESSSIGGTAWVIGQPVPSDWAMDQNIVDDPAYRDEIIDDLLAVPTVSLVLDPADLFGPDGIYVNPLERGSAWERPVSVEYFDPNSDAEFQLTAGVRVHGGASRRPDQTRKHALRLKFREIYDGNSKLEFPFFKDAPFGETAVSRFDSLVLRGSYSDGFSVGDLSWSPINLRDQWARDAQLSIGRPAPHGKYVHLYINGFYWGLYNATERIDGSFGESYYGGDKDQYDVHTDDGLSEGDLTAWNQMLAIANAGLANPEPYEQIQELLDVDDLIDYMIVEMYAGNWDWPGNNWLALRERSEAGRFRFPAWDVEVGLGASRSASGHDLNRDRTRVGELNSPANLYSRLKANADFRLRFADHIQRHFFDDGTLTPERAAALFQDRVDEVFQAIVPETARWGDHNGNGGPTANLPYTRDAEWQREIDWIFNTWFPQRSDIVVEQFREADLFPDLDAPSYSHAGGPVAAGISLQITNENDRGTIFFTTDGSDPRLPGTARESLERYDLLRDFNAASDGTFVVDLAAGSYDVTIVQGDVFRPRDAMQVSLEGTVEPPISTRDGEYVSNTYQVEVTDGQLTLTLKDLGGVTQFAVLNGLIIAPAATPNVPLWQFDFGTDASPVEAGYTRVDAKTTYSEQTDFGWTSGSIKHKDPATRPVSSAARAYSAPIAIGANVTVRSRVLSRGTWSAIREATFVTSVPADASNLAVTELDYNPAAPTASEVAAGITDNDAFEFLELTNISDQTIELGGATFTDGLRFDFGDVVLAAGQSVVVVRDVNAFTTRYGTGLRVAGQYSTGKLDNGGERIALQNAAGETIDAFTYDDDPPWPTTTDGAGPSLNRRTFNASGSAAASWIAADPSPGTARLVPAGDMNLDSVVDDEDVAGFVLALRDAAGYEAVFGRSPIAAGDMDGDGDVDFDDIAEFAAVLRQRTPDSGTTQE